MTHDELLDSFNTLPSEQITPAIKALRAVVKQTKPRGYKSEMDEFYIKGWNAAMDRVIQAIERELQ
jgi:hypothetical protein